MNRIPYFFLVVAMLSQQAAAFQVLNTNKVSLSSSSKLLASSTSLNYANGDVQALDRNESFRNSILNTLQREEPEVSISKLLTHQVAREFTAGRRYLLAAAAVKELSEDFYDVEEQQRFRAVELMEFARAHDIPIMDYASHVDKTPIDKSLETADLLQELLVQEQKDVQLLERVMMQVSSRNTELFKFLETIRADQIERKDQIIQTLSDNLSSLQASDVEAATSIATAHATTSDFSSTMGDDLLKKMENAEQLPSSFARWAETQLQGLGQQVHGLVSKSQHLTFTGATAATVAAVDSVDPDALPSTEDILEAIPMEDILQVVDTAAALLEEPSQFVDTIQPLSQIVDIVSGLY